MRLPPNVGTNSKDLQKMNVRPPPSVDLAMTRNAPELPKVNITLINKHLLDVKDFDDFMKFNYWDSQSFCQIMHDWHADKVNCVDVLMRNCVQYYYDANSYSVK